MFCINADESLQEKVIFINFNLKLEANYPLATDDKLLSKDFPIPISIMMGENDWVRGMEADAPANICNSSKFAAKSDTEEGLMVSKYHIIPTSDHNLHFDNKTALANSLINDIYNSGLEVPQNELFMQSHDDYEFGKNDANAEFEKQYNDL